MIETTADTIPIQSFKTPQGGPMTAYLFVPYPLDHAPSQRFRFEQYLAQLEAAGIRCRVSPLMSPAMYRIMYQRGHFFLKAAYCAKALFVRLADVWRARGCDICYVHREAFPIGPPFVERLLAWLGKPIIFDFDDAIYLPNASAANRFVEPYKNSGKTAAIVRLSDTVVAGNPYLATYAAHHNERVAIIPTTIDTVRYKPLARERGPRDRVCIGWSGSRTTIAHLRLLTGVLRALHERFSIRIKVIGDRTFAIPGVPVEAQDWDPADELKSLSDIDIGLMPLPDEEWAKGKCGLKALQYMALGIPAVCSPVGVNTQIIQDGVNGYLASTDAEWIDRLSRLIQEESLRQRLGQAARETVEARYSVAANAPRYIAVFRGVQARVHSASTVMRGIA